MTKQYGTPGPRALFPDVCTSPSLAACDPLAQLLFDRLLVLADDQGRVQVQPEWVKANAMPFIDEANPRRINTWLAQLAEHQVLIVYVANRVPLGQFVTWWQRQAGQRRAYPSRWPAPPGWDQDRVYGLPRDESPGARAGRSQGSASAGDVPAPSAQGAGNVRAERGQSAGHVTATRAGFRAGASADSDSPPTPSQARGRKTRRSNGLSHGAAYYDDLVKDDPERSTEPKPVADLEFVG